MAAEDAPGEALPERRLGDVAKRAGAGVEALVDVEVEIQAALRGEPEDPLELRVDVRQHEGHAAKDAGALGNPIGDLLGEGAAKVVERDQRDRLQLDPSGPFGAQLAEQGPGDPMLRRQAVEMGADRDRAVGKGAAQPELEAHPHIVLRPPRFAVEAHGLARRIESAIGFSQRGQI